MMKNQIGRKNCTQNYTTYDTRQIKKYTDISESPSVVHLLSDSDNEPEDQSTKFFLMNKMFPIKNQIIL